MKVAKSRKAQQKLPNLKIESSPILICKIPNYCNNFHTNSQPSERLNIDSKIAPLHNQEYYQIYHHQPLDPNPTPALT